MAWQRIHRGLEIEFDWLERRIAPLGFHVVLLTRREETFEAARADRLTISEKPDQYNDLAVFLDEQEVLRQLVAASALPIAGDRRERRRRATDLRRDRRLDDRHWRLVGTGRGRVGSGTAVAQRLAATNPAGSDTTKREPPKPFGSRKIRPPIAVISRRAANRPIPEPRDSTAALDPDERLEDALPVLDRDARSVVGDVDLDLVARPARCRCSRHRRSAAYFDSFSSSCSRTWRKRVPSPIAIIGSCGRSHRMGCGRSRSRSVLDGLVDRLDRIERRPRQPGQTLAAHRREDRIHEPVQPPQLVRWRRRRHSPAVGASAGVGAAAASASRST